MAKSRLLSNVALFASFFAFGVIALGAFTRLMDAGLGCPDWPGCYGHLTVLQSGVEQALASADYGTTFVSYKAWTEMAHRYFVGGLSLFIFGILIIIPCRENTRTQGNVILGSMLFLLFIYQILLGQWTVTLKLLPVIVTQHLLGGFLILAILWLIYLTNRPATMTLVKQHFVRFVPWAILLFIFTLFQILLGAWTSTNYASFSCPDFPFCVNDQSMVWHFKKAFNILSPLGINYDGGVLPESIRQTIQMSHRLGALVLTTFSFIFIILASSKLKRSPSLMKSLSLFFGLLCIQICLGISNVIFKLPLATAMAHNLVAVLILLTIITFIYQLLSLSSRVSE